MYVLIVAFFLGGNISAPIQVGTSSYATLDKCKEAAAKGTFATEQGSVGRITWCGPK